MTDIKSAFYRFCDLLIDHIKKYDQKHRTDYLQTLYCYIAKERSLVRTAEALHIHVNTLKYRLRKIRELTDMDFDDDNVRARITLSFWLL